MFCEYKVLYTIKGSSIVGHLALNEYTAAGLTSAFRKYFLLKSVSYFSQPES